jgi:hypothetical protein
MKTKETGSKETTGLNLDFSSSPVVWTPEVIDVEDKDD